ncbi:hypothetical protein PAPYR_11969 [Paratrimastix pyriformis]|uniref:Uncharacterized protein n=1 Tax=Paratrimastix pyriformis TaxID=342808 RepID=A0ABQ8U6F1_9EUKA|nr:hypothetical protein PAPYR_11969 [Paratrimastix pyriformis]
MRPPHPVDQVASAHQFEHSTVGGGRSISVLPKLAQLIQFICGATIFNLDPTCCFGEPAPASPQSGLCPKSPSTVKQPPGKVTALRLRPLQLQSTIHPLIPAKTAVPFLCALVHSHSFHLLASTFISFQPHCICTSPTASAAPTATPTVALPLPCPCPAPAPAPACPAPALPCPCHAAPRLVPAPAQGL